MSFPGFPWVFPKKLFSPGFPGLSEPYFDWLRKCLIEKFLERSQPISLPEIVAWIAWSIQIKEST